MPVRDRPFSAMLDGAQYRPYLRVKYINPDLHNGKSFITNALIDTGADKCVLPDTFAELLGHDLLAGEEAPLGGIHGAGRSYLHTMQIEIPGYCTQDVLINFVPGLKTPVLGVRTFLHKFVLVVDYPRSKFSLFHPDNYIDPSGMRDWPTP